MVQERDNNEWIAALQADGPLREAALSDLRGMLLIGLKTAPPEKKTKTYVHLMRASNQMFEPADLNRLAPRLRNKNPLDGVQSEDPLTLHENISYDWLMQGGKRSRPFITLATYDALTGGKGTLSANGLDLSDSVKRSALAIETFHKASLVHDDIEDDDTFRYGQQTLHRKYGIGTAINVDMRTRAPSVDSDAAVALKASAACASAPSMKLGLYHSTR